MKKFKVKTKLGTFSDQGTDRQILYDEEIIEGGWYEVDSFGNLTIRERRGEHQTYIVDLVTFAKKFWLSVTLVEKENDE